MDNYAVVIPKGGWPPNPQDYTCLWAFVVTADGIVSQKRED